jgi:hypothetical protein
MQNPVYINQRLREAFNFTDDDLAVNRQGWLTNQQLLHLIKRSAYRLIMASVIVTVILTVQYRLTGILFSMAYYLLLFFVFLPWRAYIQRRVKVVTGSLTKGIQPGDDAREGNFYYLFVEGLRFSVEDTVFEYFIEGRPYQIFYTPVGKLVVAAELVDEAEANAA